MSAVLPILLAWLLGWVTSATWSLRARRVEYEHVSVGARRDGRVLVVFGKFGFAFAMSAKDASTIGLGMARVAAWAIRRDGGTP